MTIPYELHLALRYLRVHRGRTFLSVITLISVAGVAVGAAALVIALALMAGLQDDVRHRVLGGAADLTVMSAAGPGPESPPEIVEKSAAVYPPAALAADREGTVVLEFTVDAEGRVGDLTIKQSAGADFDQAATDAIRKWRWKPAIRSRR